MKLMLKKVKQSLRAGSSKKRKEKDVQDERWWFLVNGGIFLKELIADCNGKSIPIRSFSRDQILKATNNFDSRCFVSQGSACKWYRGKIEDRPYMIKRFTEDEIAGPSSREGVKEAYNDFVLSARVSNHSNFLKLLGCCLEFSVPVLVFENAEHGVLNSIRITVNGEESILPWSVRLKIAKEIATAVTYLHMAFPKIIIHRNVQPRNIFLDKNWTAKLSDFTLAITLPEGKSRIEAPVMGTFGYCDPLYYITGVVTEYSDMFSFGVCLLVSITGKPAPHPSIYYGENKHIHDYVKGLYENGKLNEVIDPMMAKDITSSQKLQVEACVVLALRCCVGKEEDRPKMIQVAKELQRIERIWIV